MSGAATATAPLMSQADGGATMALPITHRHQLRVPLVLRRGALGTDERTGEQYPLRDLTVLGWVFGDTMPGDAENGPGNGPAQPEFQLRLDGPEPGDDPWYPVEDTPPSVVVFERHGARLQWGRGDLTLSGAHTIRLDPVQS